MTHSRLMSETDAWERSHWKALQNIDGPIGEWRNDYRHALVASWIAASAGNAIEPGKLIPQWDATLRDKADDVQAETDRLNRAMRQLTGGN